MEEISKSTTRNNISYLLTALLPNKDGALLGGMSGKVLFDCTTDSLTPNVLTIPQNALCHRPTEGTYVWVVDTATNKVSKRTVTAGELLPQNRIIITDGLKENETIAVSGLRFLSGSSGRLHPHRQPHSRLTERKENPAPDAATTGGKRD